MVVVDTGGGCPAISYYWPMLTICKIAYRHRLMVKQMNGSTSTIVYMLFSVHVFNCFYGCCINLVSCVCVCGGGG